MAVEVKDEYKDMRFPLMLTGKGWDVVLAEVGKDCMGPCEEFRVYKELEAQLVKMKALKGQQ